VNTSFQTGRLVINDINSPADDSYLPVR